MPYSVTLIHGVQPTSRRGVAFLESSNDARVDAKSVFERLETDRENRARDLKARFDLWSQGGTCDKYFHGWPNDERFQYCFVFKWKDAGTNHRIYGFLCHPRNPIDARFQVCVLVLHSRKNTPDTDHSLLDVVNALRQHAEVIKASNIAFAQPGAEIIIHGTRKSLDRRKR